MTSGGRFRGMVLVLVTAGLVAAAAGCSRPEASTDQQGKAGLGDLANRVAALEQRVSDLERGNAPKETQAAPGSGQESAGPQPGAAGSAGTPGATGAQPGTAGTEPQAGRAEAGQVAKPAQATVTAEVLNVRERPDGAAARIGTLRKGTVVEVLDVRGDWAKVHYGHEDVGLTGWVTQRFLKRQP